MYRDNAVVQMVKEQEKAFTFLVKFSYSCIVCLLDLYVFLSQGSFLSSLFS